MLRQIILVLNIIVIDSLDKILKLLSKFIPPYLRILQSLLFENK
jgi:hypothetical protein